MLFLPLAACSVPAQLNPVNAWRELTGANFETRIAPPGVNDASGNLGMVPARPDRPDPATRSSLDAALAADRANSRAPLPSRAEPLRAFAAESPGRPPLPAAPPPPPSLSRAEPVPWNAAPVITPGVVAPEPGFVPALPMPDLLGPPPALPR